MKEIELRNPKRENVKEIVRDIRGISERQDFDEVGKFTSNILRPVADYIKEELLKTSPFTLCFVYHPEGEVLLKGFLEDVVAYLEKNYPVHICRRILYNNRSLVYNWRTDTIKRRGTWIGSNGITIWKPQSPKSLHQWSSRKGEDKKTLRKWRVDVNDHSFYFKRMPNKWLPIFNVSSPG